MGRQKFCVIPLPRWKPACPLWEAGWDQRPAASLLYRPEAECRPREAGWDRRAAALLPYRLGAGCRPREAGWDWRAAAFLLYRLGAGCRPRDRKRAEGKPYRVYMMASANKFLRIYYATVKAYLESLEHTA